MSNVKKPTPQDMWKIANETDYDLNNQLIETSKQIILVIQKPQEPEFPLITEDDFWELISKEEYARLDAEYKAEQEQKKREKEEKELIARLSADLCRED